MIRSSLPRHAGCDDDWVMERRLFLLSLPLLLLTGCFSHLPPDASPDHMNIAWASSFHTAQQRAVVEDKPLLAVLVAGDITGTC